MKNETKKKVPNWAQLSDQEKWHIMLNTIPYEVLLNNEFTEACKKSTDLHQKVTMLEYIFFRDYAEIPAQV